MESELLKTFDENGQEVGIATREDVHKEGLWHQTFHCWFISKVEDKDFLYFQIRSDAKKDYPNLLDITAAGHLLADETIMDGIREVKEEIGIDVTMDELISLGVLKYTLKEKGMIDREIAHAFLYIGQIEMDDFKLQLEEVSGIVRAEFNSFYDFWLGDREEIRVEGFTVGAAGENNFINKKVGKESFVLHDDSYYNEILERIKEYLN